MNEVVTPIRAVAARRELLHAQIESLRVKLSEFEQELVDLDTTARVLARLGVVDYPLSGGSRAASTETAPPIPVMIKIILEELAENGTDPIERATLTKEIVARWPNVNIVSLRQTIWRLGNEGKIEVAGDLVSLKTKTGTAEDDAVDMGQEQAPPPTYPFAASELKGS